MADMSPQRRPLGRLGTTLTGAASLILFVGLAAGSCVDDDVTFPNNSGGGGAGGSGGDAASGGDGGSGGDVSGCDDCDGATPVCHDDTCVSVCPEQRAQCHTSSNAGDPDVCCEAGDKCCPAAADGYASDICHPAGEPCPIVCPDGTTLCAEGQYCLLDAETMGYSCADECKFANICGGTGCCPLGTQCQSGSCALPDLTIDAERIGASARMEKRTFAANACVIQEGCVAMPGERVLMRFDLETPNIGDGDLYLGDPSDSAELFTYSACHNHFHFESYAAYELRDQNDTVVATGHKQAFCLLDWHAYLPGADPDAVYDCQFQGIQAGWSDVYGSNLDCQWVDVTGVPPGDYKLHVSVNHAKMLGEADYTNNEAVVDVTIPADTCPNGCRDFDPGCCADGDPCGLGADGFCDCLGVFSWDAADCRACLACPAETTCTGGCTADTGVDCQTANGRANDGVCDCEGNYAWDAADCEHCVSNDPLCPAIDTCPNGCGTGNQQPACCASTTDVCGWSNDGWCDCNGAHADGWDYVDCSSCSCN